MYAMRNISEDEKGQSALEYLMTHAWALILMGLIIGVIIFVYGSYFGSLNCSSDDIKVVYVDHAVSDAGKLTLVLMNGTGRTMMYVNAEFEDGFSGTPDPISYPLDPGDLFTVSGNVGAIPGEYDGKVKVEYETTTRIRHFARLSCSGTTG